MTNKKYPKIEDKDFSEKINDQFKKFTIPPKPKKHEPIEKLCNPVNYQLQLPQKFVAEYINPDTPYKSLLIYHKIGAGKTCAAIQIAEKWKNSRDIVVVLPASLIPNFRNELRSPCAGNVYLTLHERNKLSKLSPSDLEYKNIIKESNKRIDKVYSIYSYNKFIELIKDGNISLKNSVLIIDEIQNMVSEIGTFYSNLHKLIYDSPASLRIVLMSATPMFDKPSEIALTINLLRPNKELPTGLEFNNTFMNIIKTSQGEVKRICIKNIDLFKQMIKGYVSYFRGAPPYLFPTMKIKYVECEMSAFQYDIYKNIIKNDKSEYRILKSIEKSKNRHKIKTNDDDVLDLPNNFYLGSRFVSNVVFPNKLIGEAGFKSFTGKAITQNLETYSPKFSSILKKIDKSYGKIFVYSSFKGHAGIASFKKVLDEMGYKSYAEHGEGKKRYAIWSGDENNDTKAEIQGVYNQKKNLDGSRLKIILGSPSIKEGVSLFGVQQVHIIEPYWNKSRLDQIIGRASRFCSHKDMDEDKRHVKVYIYIAVHKKEDMTVDQHIQKLSINKTKIINFFNTAIQEAAVDCTINKNANVYPGEDDITCMM